PSRCRTAGSRRRRSARHARSARQPASPPELNPGMIRTWPLNARRRSRRASNLLTKPGRKVPHLGAVLTPSPGYLDHNGSTGAVLQSDGKIVTAGFHNYYSTNDTTVFQLERYTTSGNLDGTFGDGGIVTTTVAARFTWYGNTVALQANGDIVMA